MLDEIIQKVKVPEKNYDQQPQQQTPQTPKTSVRRSARISKLPEQYSPLYYILLTNYGELERYEEAMQVETKNKWEKAMEEEMESLMHNQTWDLVKLSAGKNTV